jgi:Uma2 family endonuclease
MSIAETEILLTAEDLLSRPDGDAYELVDGRLVEHNMGAKASIVAGKIYGRLDAHCTANDLGWAVPPETGFLCFPGRPRLVRKPDAAFIRRGRLPNEEVPDGYFSVAPDLAVEVVSPNDLFYEVHEKLFEYLGAGVREVWIIDPRSKVAWIHRPDGSARLIRGEQELEGGDVLPGFRCRVADLFPPGVA